MTNENKTVLGVLTAFAVVVPLVVGLGLGWHGWVCALLMLVFLAVPAMVYRSIVERDKQRQLQDEYARQRAPRVEEQEPPSRTYVQHPVRREIPSALGEVPFQFSATVRWRVGSNPVGVPHPNPQAIAVDLVLRRAREVAASESPERYEFVQDRLNNVLGEQSRDPNLQVEACATDVVVVLSDSDKRRLDELAELRREEEKWQRTCNLERNKREYLGGDALKDTGSALVWWLVQADLEAEDVERAVKLIGTLTELSAAVNNTEIPEPFKHYVRAEAHAPEFSAQIPVMFGNGSTERGSASDALFHSGPFYDGATQGVTFAGSLGDETDHLAGLLDELGFASGGAERAMFAGRLAKLVEKSGNATAADEIRRRFDSPAAEEEPVVDIDATQPAPHSEPLSDAESRRNSTEGEVPAAGSGEVATTREPEVPSPRSEPFGSWDQ